VAGIIDPAVRNNQCKMEKEVTMRTGGESEEMKMI
jgi:hypothetical protein